MKVFGKAMCGVGFETQWKLELFHHLSGSGPYAFSTIDGRAAESWPVVELKMPFQVGQENEAMDFMIKLEKFINDNLPEPKTTNKVR